MVTLCSDARPFGADKIKRESLDARKVPMNVGVDKLKYSVMCTIKPSI